MHYLLILSSSANHDLNFWVSKLSKNGVLGVQMTRWTHRWLSPCQPEQFDEILQANAKLGKYLRETCYS